MAEPALDDRRSATRAATRPPESAGSGPPSGSRRHVATHSPEASAGTAARVRFVTAASLFDGHDASINIMRRILQSAGAEVVHLGHNRSVEEVVVAALDEDARAIAVSSYQGGHVEYFKYMADMLRERGGAEVRVFGGGGGVIIPEEMRELHGHGVTRIYSPEDGRTLGLRGMIDDMIARCDAGAPRAVPPDGLERLAAGDRRALARVITAIEDGFIDPAMLAAIREGASTARAAQPRAAALPRASTTGAAASRASATRAALPSAGIAGCGGTDLAGADLAGAAGHRP